MLQIVVMIGLPALLLVDFWNGEFPGIYTETSPYYEQLADEPGDFAIIQLPMGRSNSKLYIYLQTIHQKAIVEGLSGRTLPESYQYIENNPLLQIWSRNQSVDCNVLNQQQVSSAADQLLTDGFRYVIVHRQASPFAEEVAGHFEAEPIYQDSDLTAFRLEDVRDQPSCQNTYERVYELPVPENPTSISWNQEIGLLGYDLGKIDTNTGALPITLYWQGLTEMENSYMAYFHLIDKETEMLVAATDVLPRGWSYPTSWWAAGEVVEDTVQIPLESVPPGQYDLYIGWYDTETGQRLPPSSDQLPLTADNRALLTDIDY